MLSLASRSSHCRLPTPTASRKAPSSRVQVKAMGGIFGGLFGGASRAGQGCELAPKEAPPGLKLATFAGRHDPLGRKGMHAVGSSYEVRHPRC